MKYKLIFILSILGFNNLLQAQTIDRSVIHAAGGQVHPQLLHNVGETFVGSYGNNNFMLTQGFIQPQAILYIPAISGDLSLCLGETTSFQDSLSGGSWSSNNLQVATINANTGFVTTVGVGTALISYSIGDASVSAILEVHALPTGLATTTQYAICPNGNTTLTASGCATYLWSNGDTSSTTTVNQAGNYYVIATNEYGCADTSNMVSITQKAMPTTVKIKYNGASTVCEPATVNYQLDMPLGSTTGFAYQWYLAGTSIPGATDSVFSASASGAYSISVSGGANCFKISPAKPAVVKQQPVANFTAAGPTTICSGELVTLTAPTITGYVYTWLKDGVAVGSGATKSFKLAGNYTVVAKLNGCTDTSTQTIAITVNPLPVAGVTAINNIVFCAGDSCTIVATPNVVGNQYKWFNGNTELTTTSTPSYTVGISGTFKVMVKDTNQCVSKLSSTNIKTKMNPIPVAGINAASSTTISANGSVKLKATPSSGVTWQWYKDGQPLAGATSNQYIATTGGSYTVAITKTGCTGMSAATTVTQTGVKEEVGITSTANFELVAYPNPVSDVLSIIVRGVEEVKATIQVMDFSGKLVATKEMITTSTTVDMTGYASGVYLIRYKDAEGRTGTIKITKE